MSKNTHISVEPNTPAEVKTRIPVWLYPSTLEVMDRAMKIANCKSRSEYLEKAALFYAGYVSGQDATAYLPPALQAGGGAGHGNECASGRDGDSR